MNHPPCIFCANESGSEEHLWPDWMHRLVIFAPINMQEADGPVIVGQDPEQTINTVCRTCNNGWMSQIEQKCVSRLKPMLLNQPLEIDPGGMKLLTEWAVLRAMVFESIKPRNDNENFYAREERIAFREGQTIPDRTRVWGGALEKSHIGYHGTDFTLEEKGERVGTGSVGTVYAGHIVMQVVTEHLSVEAQPGGIIVPPPGPWDQRLVEIHPNRPRRVNWPTQPFTDEGPTGIIALHARWRMGKKTNKIKNL